MDRFFGFDLGDAESAVARLEKNKQQTPLMLAVGGQKSFITAYAQMPEGELKIGEKACYETKAVRRKLRFKSSFMKDPAVMSDVKRFGAGVLGELYGNGDLIKNEDACFYIGCPAGWGKNDRERYREIFERVGYPPVKIVAESRAALVSACQSRHLQVGYDILAKPLLVVDIGSSTTDFAYVCGGKEVDIQTAGEVQLGGGIMDEILLERCVAMSKNEKIVRKVFADSEAWKNYCEFAARRLKEKYFSGEDYWEKNRCAESVLIQYDEPVRLTLMMDQDMADALINQRVAKLDNRSFRQVFMESLKNVRKAINGDQPQLLFLTGGVSKLPYVRSWCEEVFPEAVIINGAEPEFSVARGLAWCGQIDEEVREFRMDLDELNRSDVVEGLVSRNINSLYHAAVDILVEPIIRNAVVPVFEKWRKGEIRRLEDTDSVMQSAIEAYLKTDEAKALLVKPITDWLRPISDALEEHTVPICLRHHVPYSAMSLKSYLAESDIDIKIEAKKVFAVTELTWILESVISLVISLFCGGSGVALIASGPVGIIIGFLASFAMLAMGKKQVEKVLLHADLPVMARKLVPRNLFEAHMDSVTNKVKDNLYHTLENEKNEEITGRMVREISLQIEQCLTKMAEIVEIPLG